MNAMHIAGRMWVCEEDIGATICWASRGVEDTKIFNVYLSPLEIAELACALSKPRGIWRSEERDLTVNVNADRLMFLFTDVETKPYRRALAISGSVRAAFEAAILRLFVQNMVKDSVRIKSDVLPVYLS